MARNEQTRFWPYDNQNLMAAEMIEAVPRDPNRRTLPMTIPGPTVDADGNPLPENDPRRREQRFDSFIPIVVDDVVATKLMEYNTVNRKPSKNNLRSLTQIILNGEWRFNGKSSRLPCSNTALQDAQHTLQSVITAFTIGRANNTPVRPILMEPIIGLHPTVFDTIDGGRIRTTKDTLYCCARISEIDLLEVNEAVWSHALRLMTQYVNLTQNLTATDPFYMDNIRDRLPNNRVRELFNMSPQLQESINYCSRFNIPTTGALISLAVIGTAHAIISEVQSSSAANGFARSLATGANLDETSPIHQLREQIIRDKSSKKRTEGIDMLAMCIRTWNNMAQHKQATQKRIRAFNADKTFPLPITIQRRSATVTR